MSESNPEANNDSVERFSDELTSETSVDTVVKAMLTENTGRHFLDSGDHYGRNHEENRESPPWEKPRTIVEKDYVVRNVYHHLTEWMQRDGACLRLERRLYASAEDRGAWLADMEEFAEDVHDDDRITANRGHAASRMTDHVYVQTFNTYNHEFGSLTQCIQGVGFTYGGDSYVALQVHGGCDIRGGYTKPRVFAAHWTELIPGEFHFWCPDCEWQEAESCLDWDTLESMTIPHVNRLECPECGEDNVSP